MKPWVSILVLLGVAAGGLICGAGQPARSSARPSFDELIQIIHTGNAYQRAEAVAPLSCINDPRVVPELMVLLGDEDATVRVYAAQQLARLADARSADALAAALADSSRGVRQYAGEGLATIGRTRHVPALVASVISHLPDPNTSDTESFYSAPVLEAIARLSPNAPPELVGLLEEISTADRIKNEDSWRLLENVANCLGRIGDRMALQPLERARERLEAGHQDYKAWYAVRKALAAMDPEKAPFDRPAADILDSVRLGKIDAAGIRRKWVLPLVELGEQGVSDLGWALWFDSDWDRTRVQVATEALGDIGGRDAADALRQHIERDSALSDQNRRARLLLLREMLPALLKADPNETTVDEILVAGQQLGAFEQEYLIHDISATPPERISGEVKMLFYRMALLGGKSAKPLGSYAANRAAALLGQMGGAKAGEILSSVVLDLPRSERGEAAIRALRAIRGYDAVPTLLKALKLGKAGQGTIAHALGAIADKRAVPALKDAANSGTLAGQDRLWVAAALARLCEDYTRNARLIRETLPDSLEQAAWLHDDATISAVAALIGSEAGVTERAIHTLEAIGTDRALGALVGQIDLETVADPTHLQNLSDAAARLAKRLGHPSAEYWAGVTATVSAVRAWFAMSQQTGASESDRRATFEAVTQNPGLARHVWIAEVNRRLDLAASGKGERYEHDVPSGAVSSAGTIFAPEMVETMERIARESKSSQSFHGRRSMVEYYGVRSLAAKILTEKTGEAHTFVDADGRTHPGGWNPSMDE
jgi:HEAT repeat protein